MHPLSIFPELLNFDFFSATILRVVVALFIIYLGRNRQTKIYPFSSLLYYALGALLFLGLYTQIAGIIAILVVKFDFYLNYYKNKTTSPISKENYFLYGFAIVILLSLIITGPGAYAMDLPL